MSRTWSRRRPRASGGESASNSGGSAKWKPGDSSWSTLVARLRHQLPRLVPPRGLRALEQRHQPGYAFLRQRAVADIFIGERLLLHLGPHVPGIHPVNAPTWILLGKDGRQVLQRG